MNEHIIQATLSEDILIALPTFLFSILFAVLSYRAYKKKEHGIVYSCLGWLAAIVLFSMSIMQVKDPVYDYITKSYYTNIGYVSGYDYIKKPYIIINDTECRITKNYYEQQKYVGKSVMFTIGVNSNYIVSIEEK